MALGISETSRMHRIRPLVADSFVPRQHSPLRSLSWALAWLMLTAHISGIAGAPVAAACQPVVNILVDSAAAAARLTTAAACEGVTVTAAWKGRVAIVEHIVVGAGLTLWRGIQAYVDDFGGAVHVEEGGKLWADSCEFRSNEGEMPSIPALSRVP
ncbi:hypothetical protein JKP88DRAFT_283208 [Tribonema minus]|uniref:Uncharacterized protein n=1 Tax=Tribonema minus TaxID=303371 RepID=A0A835YIH3_9STRA|nr:hypothetical protein JKP88DRAFT_283208 [Tribonema minus]